MRIRTEIKLNPPDLFVCGHSHILKVMPDKNLNLIHMNRALLVSMVSIKENHVKI